MNSQQNNVFEKNTPINRSFTVYEQIFAWLCFAAGYVFCRVFPVKSSPFGGFLFVVALFLATSVIFKLMGKKIPQLSVSVMLTAIITSFSLILCSNSFLHLFAYAYALAVYVYFVYSVLGNNLKAGFNDLIVADFFKALFIMPFYSLSQLHKALFSGKAKNSGKAVFRIFIGIIIAIVPTVVVLILLSYDESFTKIIDKIFDFDFSDIFSHIGSLVLGFPIGMYVFGLYVSSADNKCKDILTEEKCKKAASKVKIVPVLTVTAAVVPLILIYIVFFISQWQYYISGFTGILPEQFSYAAYAREGFFQLCTVSVINLLVILSAMAFIRKSKAGNTAIKWLTVIYSVFTLILISTAVAKMVMYINCYGLTQKRLYATWFMLVLAVVFVLIGIRRFIPKFNALALSLAACVILFSVLALSNADGLIARYNINRYINGTLKTVDIQAMDELGDAATVELVRLAEFLDEKNGTDISKADSKAYVSRVYYDLAQKLESDAGKFEKSGEDIFSFTIPALRARNALKRVGLL